LIASASISTAVKVPAAMSLIGWFEALLVQVHHRLGAGVAPAISRDQAVPANRPSPSDPVAPSTLEGRKPLPAAMIPAASSAPARTP
jgi:hypothetical protein